MRIEEMLQILEQIEDLIDAARSDIQAAGSGADDLRTARICDAEDLAGDVSRRCDDSEGSLYEARATLQRLADVGYRSSYQMKHACFEED